MAWLSAPPLSLPEGADHPFPEPCCPAGPTQLWVALSPLWDYPSHPHMEAGEGAAGPGCCLPPPSGHPITPRPALGQCQPHQACPPLPLMEPKHDVGSPWLPPLPTWCLMPLKGPRHAHPLPPRHSWEEEVALAWGLWEQALV